MTGDTELPYFQIDDVWDVMGYPNRRAALTAIRLGKFQVPTYQLRPRKTVVDRKVLRAYFGSKRQNGLDQLG